MLKPLTLLLASLFLFHIACAQIKRKIKKSRRNKSQSQYTLEKNEFQYEWEAGYETFNSTLQTATYPNMVFHYGISDKLEVNSEVTLLTAIDKSQPIRKNTSGVEPIGFGLNYLMIKESPMHPAVIGSLQLAIPFLATNNFTATHLAPIMQINIRQPFSKKLTIGIAPGIFWDGFSTNPSYLYNLDTDYNPSYTWQISPEIFGFISNNSAPQHNIDLEVDHKFSGKIQLGIVLGKGLSPAAHKSYFAVCGVYDLHPHHNKIITSQTGLN